MSGELLACVQMCPISFCTQASELQTLKGRDNPLFPVNNIWVKFIFFCSTNERLVCTQTILKKSASSILRGAHISKENIFVRVIKLLFYKENARVVPLDQTHCFFIFWPCGTQNMSECVFQPKYLVILTESLLCRAISKKKERVKV